jgi:hypothetical protein
MKRDFFHTGLNVSRSYLEDLATLANNLRTALLGDYPISAPTLAIGSNKDDVASAAFTYTINGIQYQKTAVTTGTGPGATVVPEDTYGAVAFDIDAAGTITAVDAAANATGYATAALAIAGLPAAAATKCRMGWITVIGTAAAFTLGTTLLDAANTAVTFNDAPLFSAVIGSAVS